MSGYVGAGAEAASSPRAASAAAMGSSELLASLDRRTKRLAFAGLALSDAAAAAAFSLLAPFYPKAARGMGLGDSTVGAIFAAFALVVFVGSPLLGARLRALGRRRMLCFGLLLLSVSTAAFALLPRVHNPTTYAFVSLVLRMVQGAGAACTQTASYSLTAALFPEQLSLYLGVSETLTGLGFMAGPPLGGWLFMLGGFSLPFVVLGALPLGVVAALAKLVPPAADGKMKSNSEGSEQGSEQGGGGGGGNGGFRALRLVSRRPGVMVVVGICTVANSAYAFLEPTLEPAFGHREGVNEGVIGLLFLTVSLTYTATAPLAGVAADARRYGARGVMLAGVALLAAAFLLIGPSPLLLGPSAAPPKRIWFLLASLALAGVGQSMALVPTMDSMVQQCTDLGEDGVNVAAGLINSANSLGEMLGPMAGTALCQHLGWPWATTAWALALLVLLALEALFDSWRKGHALCGHAALLLPPLSQGGPWRTRTRSHK